MTLYEIAGWKKKRFSWNIVFLATIVDLIYLMVTSFWIIWSISVWCDSLFLIIYVCFIFLCVAGNSTLSTSILSDIWDNIQNLDWPWWIAVGFIVAMVVLMAYCIKHACKAKRRQQSKVDNVFVKETKNVGHSKQKIEVGHNTVKDKVKLKKRGNLRHIQVESIHQHQQRI